MWVIFIFSLNNRTSSSLDRKIINLSCTRRRTPPWINITMSRAHADACGSFRIALSKAFLDNDEPVV